MSNLRGFIDAVKSGWIKDVKRRFRKEYVNATVECRRTALHWACINNNDGSGDIVRYLVSEGWNIEAKTDTEQWRPIHYAAYRGNISAMTALIEARCIPDCRDCFGLTPIEVAMKHGGDNRDECVRLLRSAMMKKQMMEYLSADEVMSDDTQSLKTLHNLLEYYYDNMKRANITFIRPSEDSTDSDIFELRGNLRPSLKKIITQFNDRYREDIFTRIKMKEPMNDKDKILIKIITLTISIIGQYSDIVKDTQNGRILIEYLEYYLSDDATITPNNASVRVCQICLYSLCDLVEYDDLDIPDNAWMILWRYFTDTKYNEYIKISSAYSLMHLSKRASFDGAFSEDMSRVIDYMLGIVQNTETISTKEYLGFTLDQLDGALSEVPKIERQMKHFIASLNCKKEILLGEGAFGRVIRCTDDDVGYNFAVKKVTRFEDIENEIKIYNKMEEHDRIVKYYGTNSTSDAIYIFMECMEGGSIADYLKKHGALTPDKIAHYTKQVLHGLDFLHRKRIIHRDIKGANILRDAQDDIKLCDFGISRYLQIITSLYTMEKTKTECGTPYWMAPEVINGEEYRFSADIWSLGATVVEMLTGTHPYPRLSTIQAMLKIANTRKLEYDTPESMTPILQSFIDQMLVPDPMERALIDALLASDFIRDAS